MSREKKSVTRDEVRTHCTEQDLWVVIDDKVYDLTKWAPKHPGGKFPLLGVAGRDATEVFYNYHNEWVNERLRYFHVANLVASDVPVSQRTAEFRALTRRLQEDGLFQTNYFWYFRLFLWLASLFVLGVLPPFYFPSSTLAIVIGGISLAAFWQQMAFAGHDLCHNAFTHNRTIDSLISSTIASLVGVSAQWWKHTHNVHHVVVNSIISDPDVQHLPAIAISDKLFKGVHSKYHEEFMPFNAIAKFLVSYQHYLYYFVMGFARINLYVQSFRLHFRNRETIPFRWLDLSSLVFFWVWYIALLSTMTSWKLRMTYIFLSHFLVGLLHVQITISHFAMPVNDRHEDVESDYDFVLTQYQHSMDVDCPPWLDWFHGGLQYQVVHHLWPRIPRHNLRYVRDNYFLPFTKKHGLTYHIHDFIESNAIVVRTLRDAAVKAKKLDSTALSPIWSTTY